MSSPLTGSIFGAASEAAPFSHPDLLALGGAAAGLRVCPPPVARVLELGSGSGGNLLALAYRLPEARFVGVEAHPERVASVAAAAAALGLQNVSLHAAELEALVAQGASFDYVLAPNLLSSVAPQTESSILAACRRLLAPTGVLYVECLGVAAGLVGDRLRDLVRQRARALPTVAARVGAIRELLLTLDAVEPTPQNPQTVVAKAEVSFARQLDDAALIQHFLAPYRRAMAPSELARAAEAHGLALLGEAIAPGDEAQGERAKLRAGLRATDAAPALIEDLIELIRPSRRHRLLFARSDARPEPGALTSLLDLGELRAQLTTRLDDVALDPGLEVSFSTPERRLIRARDPLGKALLAELRDAWPAGARFGALVEAAAARVREACPAHLLPPDPRGAQAPELLALIQSSAVRWRSRAAAEPGELPSSPRLSPLAAWEASRGPVLTDPSHRLVAVDALTWRIARLLDGSRDAAALEGELARWLEAGELSGPEGSAPPDDVSEVVAKTLRALYAAGVLESV